MLDSPVLTVTATLQQAVAPSAARVDQAILQEAAATILVTQFNKIRDLQHQKWPEANYIGYFQAYTNTYAPVEELREYYEEILEQPVLLDCPSRLGRIVCRMMLLSIWLN